MTFCDVLGNLSIVCFLYNRFKLVVPRCTELRENLGREDLGRFMLVGCSELRILVNELVLGLLRYGVSVLIFG